jgi:hypothetical protein
MKAKGDNRLRIVGWLISFSILLALTSGIARGEGLYTRTDELSCGNTVVQAYTTCTEESQDVDTADCTEQHFLFVNKKTGASVRVEGRGKRVVRRDVHGGKTRAHFNGLARAWTCLESRAGFFVFIEFVRNPGADSPHPWEELWDLKGRRLASNEGDSDEASARFYKIWKSKDLVTHPLPIMDFVPIQIFKTDRVKPWN